jgi:hypothetical protein
MSMGGRSYIGLNSHVFSNVYSKFLPALHMLVIYMGDVQVLVSYYTIENRPLD